MSNPLFARSFPALAEHAHVELSPAEAAAQTIALKIRELEAAIAAQEEAISASLVTVDRQRLVVSRARAELAEWKNLHRWATSEEGRD